MSKFVKLKEGALVLETTINSIMVTACNYKRKYGAYPVWYSSNGKRGAIESYVDVEPLLRLRGEEIRIYEESSGYLYYLMLDEFGYTEASLSRLLADKSEIYKSKNSWLTFMQQNLFMEPVMKFTDKPSRMREFYRICKKEENEKNKSLHIS